MSTGGLTHIGVQTKEETYVEEKRKELEELIRDTEISHQQNILENLLASSRLFDNMFDSGAEMFSQSRNKIAGAEKSVNDQLEHIRKLNYGSTKNPMLNKNQSRSSGSLRNDEPLGDPLISPRLERSPRIRLNSPIRRLSRTTNDTLQSPKRSVVTFTASDGTFSWCCRGV